MATSSRKATQAMVGIGCPAPVFAVRDLTAARTFYERLGFDVRRYDALKAELRRRWYAGTPIGLVSKFVADKSWGVRGP